MTYAKIGRVSAAGQRRQPGWRGPGGAGKSPLKGRGRADWAMASNVGGAVRAPGRCWAGDKRGPPAQRAAGRGNRYRFHDSNLSREKLACRLSRLDLSHSGLP